MQYTLSTDVLVNAKLVSFLTEEKDMDIEEPPDSKYKLIQVVDRGSLKWPSNCILEAIVTLWKVFSTIVNDADLNNSFINGLSRNIIVGITTSIIENAHGEQWRVVCRMCGTLRWDTSQAPFVYFKLHSFQ